MKRSDLHFRYTGAGMVTVEVALPIEGGCRIEVLCDQMASREWLLIGPGEDIQQHSDCGYGQAGPALRDGLIAYFGLPERGNV